MYRTVEDIQAAADNPEIRILDLEGATICGKTGQGLVISRPGTIIKNGTLKGFSRNLLKSTFSLSSDPKQDVSPGGGFAAVHVLAPTCVLDRVTIADAEGHGVLMHSGAAAVRMINCTVSGCTGSGIVIDAGAQSMVIGGEVSRSGTGGANAKSMDDKGCGVLARGQGTVVLVKGLRSTGNSASGIEARNGAQVAVTGGVVADNLGHGIVASGQESKLEATEVVISGQRHEALFARDGAKVDVHGCQILVNGGKGNWVAQPSPGEKLGPAQEPSPAKQASMRSTAAPGATGPLKAISGALTQQEQLLLDALQDPGMESPHSGGTGARPDAPSHQRSAAAALAKQLSAARLAATRAASGPVYVVETPPDGSGALEIAREKLPSEASLGSVEIAAALNGGRQEAPLDQQVQERLAHMATDAAGMLTTRTEVWIDGVLVTEEAAAARTSLDLDTSKRGVRQAEEPAAKSCCAMM
ncbi:unnamed protein product [Pedinophyceae sp. YPF-701]|nr:unnamed protein product [Pedinophyceae sp. YPF-701]